MRAIWEQQVLTFLAREDTDDSAFNEIALGLFTFQCEANPVYGRYAHSLGRGPSEVKHWRDIPALPTDAFKFPAYPLRTFPEAEVKTTFFTSGTTRDVRGRHDFASTVTYEASILQGWESLGLPLVKTPVFFSLPPTQAQHSSLVHMFETLREAHSQTNAPWLLDADGSLDLEPLKAAIHTGKPLALLGTALAFLHALENYAPIALPAGSWLMETGGYKGTKREIPRDELHAMLAVHFSLPPSRILNEYSMTELSSQFYAWSEEEAHRGPHWTRIRIIDPETNREVPLGAIGYLEIIDLANVGSAMAIRTQDLAIARDDRSFILIGRDPGALPRGCSRAADDLLSR